MVLKTKLSLGLGFLFLIIFALAAFCSYYIEQLAMEADNILKDNYNSIVYSKSMLVALDDMNTAVGASMFGRDDPAATSEYYRQLFAAGKTAFETNLQAEKGNITEIHEREVVERLDHDYGVFLKLSEQLAAGPGSSAAYFQDVLPARERVRESINGINDLNMQAVVRKSQLARRDSSRFVTSMAIIGSLSLLLALGYFWYFPFYVSNTFSYLAGRMARLLQGAGIDPCPNTRDEAFVLLHGINALEKKLGLTAAEAASGAACGP
jgi:two-component system, NtrC family, sensor histidine kinase KinB